MWLRLLPKVSSARSLERSCQRLSGQDPCRRLRAHVRTRGRVFQALCRRELGHAGDAHKALEVQRRRGIADHRLSCLVGIPFACVAFEQGKAKVDILKVYDML